jgi:hypothetical protein
MDDLDMFEALERLADSDPEAAWADIPAHWYEDSDGVAHHIESHRPADATRIDATLGRLVDTPRCERRRCCTVQRCAGPDGVVAASAAQTIAGLVEIYDDLACSDDPFETVLKQQQKERLLQRRRTQLEAMSAELAPYGQQWLTKCEGMIADAQRQVFSDDVRDAFVRESAETAVWLCEPHWLALRERMAGTHQVAEGAKESEPLAPKAMNLLSDDSELFMRSQAESVLARLDRLFPTRLTQLRGMDIPLGVDPKAAASEWWRDQVRKELTDVLRDLDEKIEQLVRADTLSIVDLRYTLGRHEWGLLNRFVLSSENPDLTGSGMRESYTRYFGASGRLTDAYTTKKAQLLFTDGRTRGHLAIMPEAVAKALTGFLQARVDLGVARLDKRLEGILDTTVKLMSDGGIFDNLVVAWDAAVALDEDGTVGHVAGSHQRCVTSSSPA